MPEDTNKMTEKQIQGDGLNSNDDNDQTKKEHDSFAGMKQDLENMAKQSLDFVKQTFQRVKIFSKDATELTRLKIERKKVLDEKEKILLTIGEKVWETTRTGNDYRQLDFGTELDRLASLEEKLKKVDEEIAAIDLLGKK